MRVLSHCNANWGFYRRNTDGHRYGYNIHNTRRLTRRNTYFHLPLSFLALLWPRGWSRFGSPGFCKMKKKSPVDKVGVFGFFGVGVLQLSQPTLAQGSRFWRQTKITFQFSTKAKPAASYVKSQQESLVTFQWGAQALRVPQKCHAPVFGL